MIKVLFVCHGNTCRSPMAEFVMKELAGKTGLSDCIQIASAGTGVKGSRGGSGNPISRSAWEKLRENGVSCAVRYARQMDQSDYRRYDLLIGMDSVNIRNMRSICGGDPEGKIKKLLDFTGRGGDVEDPWYTQDYETAWQDIREGCEALLEALRADANIKK